MLSPQTKRTVSLLSIILAGESIFFLPFVLPRIFRPTVLSALDITNIELGAFFSVYGLVAMVAYLFGGHLADLFSSRKMMATALWGTALGGFAMALTMESVWLPYIYGFWGMTTILLFWSAMIKATRAWGSNKNQGRAFAFLDGGRGLIAASLGTLSLLLFSPSDVNVDMSVEEGKAALSSIIFVMSGITVVSGILVWLFVQDAHTTEEEKIHLKDWIPLLKERKLWLLSIIVVCGYVGYKLTDDFSLYAKEILNFSEKEAATLGTTALWLRAIVGLSIGWIGDRIGVSKLVAWGFASTFVLAGALSFQYSTSVVVMILVQLVFVAMGIYAVRSLYFALVQRSNIPLEKTGTAVGIVSFVGFTPDVFAGPWMGYYLEEYPGIVGHQKVFLLMACFAFVGLLAVVLLKRTLKAKAEQ